MSLAVLDLLELGRGGPRFTIDTGTSRYFQLRVGRLVEHRYGEDWVDDVTYTTPIRPNPNGGNPFNSRTEVALPAARLAGGTFVQLFSFRDAQGGSPTFSGVVQISSVVGLGDGRSPPLRVPKMTRAASFEAPRRIAHAGISDRYAMGSSIDDVVASVVKLATPIVERLLGDKTTNGASPDKPDALGNVLAVLLKALVGNGASGAPSLATSLALPASGPDGNRFAGAEFARPFIFGIDDALIGALAGPVLQMLPQLLNSANQRKVQMRQADDKLMSDLVSAVNRRLILQQLASAQPQNAAASPEVARLIALLQPGAEASTAMPAAASTPVVATSLSAEASSSSDRVSSRAIVTFQLADALPWNDTTKPLFAKGAAVRLNAQLTVGAPVPRAALPKAIVRIVFRTAATHSQITEKTFKQKGLAANMPFALDFSAADLAPLPVNEPIEVVAELRWRTSSGTSVFKAMGSTEVVFVNQYLLKSQGPAVTSEVEITDMKRFRPFWNKLWESPVLDAASGARADKKYVWELGVTVKYSVLLSAVHDANGLMETKLIKAADDPDSVVQRTEGRMKAGIELSARELNKLLPLWQGHDPLPAEKLEALTTEKFAASNAGEVITSIKVKGNAGERGMVWAVPVFRLVQCTLAKVSKTDDSSQVTGLTEEVVGFPVAVATRLIGLKATSGALSMSTSADDDAAAGAPDAAAEPDYAFEGYQVVFSVKVGLTPPSKSAAMPVARDPGAN